MCHIILDRSVIVHRMPDDFKTQPSGDAGTKIGCGVIRKTEANLMTLTVERNFKRAGIKPLHKCDKFFIHY